MLELFKMAGEVTIHGIDTATKQIRSLEKAAYKTMKPITQLGKRAERTGMMLTKRLTVPLGLLGGAAVKFAGDFEKALTTSTAIMSGVTEELRTEMSDTAKQLSTESTFSAKELAESYYYLASAGLTVEQSIAALGKVTKFAEAGQMDMKQATDLLTDAQSALGLATEDVVENEENMVRISDVLVKANTLANASVEQFAESLTNKAAASLRVLGKDVEEGVAVLAAFANQGTKGEEAGTQLAIVLRDLQKSALANKGEFKKTGIAVFDAAGEMRNMADVIGDVEDALDGKSDAEKKATLSMLGFQERSVQSLLTLIGTSEAIREYEDALRDAAGTTNEVAEKQLQNFNDQMKIMYNRLKVAAIGLGDEILPLIKNYLFPALESLIGKLKDIIQFFKEMDPQLKKLTIGFTAAVAIMGPLLVGFGKFALMLSSLPGFITAVKIALQGMTLALSTNPVFAAITAIAALTAGVVVLTTAYKSANSELEKHRKLLKEDIEQKQITQRNAMLQELIYHYQKLNEAATSGAPGDLYYSIKKNVDNLERSLSALGVTFEGSYITRLQEAKNKLFELNSEELEAINIMGNANDLVDENNDGIDDSIEGLEARIKMLNKQNEELEAQIELIDEIDAKIAEENEEMKRQSIAWDKSHEDINNKYLKLNAETLQEKIDIVEQEWKAELALASKYGSDISAVNEYYEIKIRQMREENAAQNKEQHTQLWTDRLNTINNYTQQAGNILQGFYDNEAIRIDNNYKRQQQSIEDSSKSEEEKKKALENLDKEYDAKRAALQKKQMVASKAQAIFDIGVNTAVAIMQALSKPGGPLGWVLTGVIAALGAAQAAMVASKPIPEMAEGGIIPKSQGGTLVRAGEAGQDEGFIPMKTGTASIAHEIMNNMRRFPFGGQQGNAGGAIGGIPSGAVNLNIGTLVADDKGLTELERRLKTFRIAENNRLGIA